MSSVIGKYNIPLCTDFLEKKNERPVYAPMWEPMMVPAIHMPGAGIVGREIPPSDVQPEHIIENAELAAKNLDDLYADMPIAFQAGCGHQWMEAICGCKILSANDSLWAKELPNPSLEAFLNIEPNEAWIEKLLECHKAMVEWVTGRYFCAVPVLHGPLDILVGCLGGMEVACAFYEEPELLEEALKKATELYISVSDRLVRMLRQEEGGYVGRMNIYTQKPCITLQNDATYMTSPEIFRRVLQPLEKQVVGSIPNVVYHMHNTSLHLWEAMTETGLSVVQISVDPNGPDLEKQIGIYEQMKKRVPLVLACWSYETLEIMRKRLTPQGLALTYVPSASNVQLDEKGRFGGFEEWNQHYQEWIAEG